MFELANIWTGKKKVHGSHKNSWIISRSAVVCSQCSISSTSSCNASTSEFAIGLFLCKKATLRAFRHLNTKGYDWQRCGLFRYTNAKYSGSQKHPHVKMNRGIPEYKKEMSARARLPSHCSRTDRTPGCRNQTSHHSGNLS